MSRFEDMLDRFFYRPDEDVGPFLELAPEVELVPRPQAEEIPEDFLAFDLGGEIYAVPIASVREIMKVPPITPVPRARRHVLGVMNVRGEMLPLYDVKGRLRLSDGPVTVTGPADAPRTARVVLLKDMQGDAGVLVDGVRGVVKLTLSRLTPAPNTGSDSNCVAGLGRDDDLLIILLDVAQALA